MSSQSAGPQLSVVVPTYNRAPALRRTLASLVDQRTPPPFEVIVADDGSTDDSEQAVAEFRDRLTVRYCYQEDKGYRVAAARNMGAAMASAPILVFLDSGTIAGPDLVTAHLRRHREHRLASRSSCGPAVIGYTYGYQLHESTPGLAEALALMTPQQVHERYHAERWFQDMRHEELAKTNFDLSELRLPWMFFWTMNVSVPAEDYAAVGGFDERFRDWGNEDLELGYRLHRRGVPLVFDTRPWAVENPTERDHDASMVTAKRNALQILQTHADPAVELFWAEYTRTDGNMWPAEDAYRALLEWADQAAGLDVQPEVDRGTADLRAGMRVAIFGSGASVPSDELRGTLVDFDPRLLNRAPVDGRFSTHLGLGIRTPLPDGAFDRVVITSRLAVPWPEWGEAISAEAARIGTSVCGPPMAAPLPGDHL